MSPRALALITGASSGIGRALALEFAAGGYDVCLVARSEADLREARDECVRTGVRAHVCATDLSTPAGRETVLRFLEENRLAAEILVNNAGYGVHGFFSETELASESALVELQIQATLELTKAMLPPMLLRRKGAILNIASVYSFSPVPRQAVYGACKAFLLSFGEALAVELEGSGVHVTTVCPGVTQTRFRTRSGMREKKATSGMTAARVAQVAFRACRQKRRIVVPGGTNKFFVKACRILPMVWISGAVKRINGVRGIHAEHSAQIK